ncbi:MAG: ABC transporter permease [Ruminococcus sp.]|nr:ABC transporter permease [Ruminococcus sp.]MDD7669650.1 ABC transporter permease [Ruminococcus sp.]
MLDAQFWKDIAFGLWETTYMVFLSTLFAYILGMPLGVLLVVTDEKGLKPIPWLNKTIGFIVNILRSVPFVILLIMIIPFTRFLVGTASGSFPTIVPLTVAAFPFIARLVEGSLKELDGGIVEAAKSMGATNMQIVTKVMIPESVPSLINGAAIAITTILSYSAMAGICGGGGLGKIAINEGYYRYIFARMIVPVIILVVIVQVFQTVGDKLSRKCDKRIR